MTDINPLSPNTTASFKAIDWADCTERTTNHNVTYLNSDITRDTLQLHRNHRSNSMKVIFASVVESEDIRPYEDGEEAYLRLRERYHTLKAYPEDLRPRIPQCNPQALEYYDNLENEIHDYLQSRNVPLVSGASFFMHTMGITVDIAIPNQLFKFTERYTKSKASRDNATINLALASLQRLHVG